MQKLQKADSDVWYFFKLVSEKINGQDIESYECTVCKMKYVYTKATSSLLRHLKSKHSESYNKYLEDNGIGQKQVQQQQIEDLMKIKKLTSSKQEQISVNIVRYIVTDMNLNHLIIISNRFYQNYITK
eukprot:TRINITY_DN36469_c0_g1_i2.p1 TRINITY_DN36469_c0_g1~~TRINITY_DN36469_c0_g1_i2.p1  ORF type:complete len:128 (-),score=23.55 TRINITY_DN36469_c0_g1_i2:250-633(-)